MNMGEMMKQCCGEGGTPDAEKMKQVMESCGKKEFDGMIDGIRSLKKETV